MNDQCYVYKWTHLPSLNYYVGSSTRDNSHPDNGYICSSKIVKPLIEQKPWEWKREIIAIGNKIEMRELETDILQLFDAKNDPKSFNRTNGNKEFFVSKGRIVKEYTKRKLKESNKKRYEREKELGIIRTGSDKQKEAVRKANKGKQLSDHTKKLIGEKNSILLKGRKKTIDSVNKMLDTKKKNGTLNPSEETRLKIKNTLLSKKQTKSVETIEKIKQKQISNGTYKKPRYFQPIIADGLYFSSSLEAIDYYACKWKLSKSRTQVLILNKLKNNESNWIRLPKIKNPKLSVV